MASSGILRTQLQFNNGRYSPPDGRNHYFQYLYLQRMHAYPINICIQIMLSPPCAQYNHLIQNISDCSWHYGKWQVRFEVPSAVSFASIFDLRLFKNQSISAMEYLKVFLNYSFNENGFFFSYYSQMHCCSVNIVHFIKKLHYAWTRRF